MTRTCREPTQALRDMKKIDNLLWTLLEWVSAKRYPCYEPVWFHVTESEDDPEEVVFWKRCELTWKGRIWEFIEERITDKLVPF